MKNKLTNEEKLLQSKLEEVSFEYNEANWSELQNAMGKKGGVFNFTPFFKATIGLLILASAVFLINKSYTNKGNLSTNSAIQEEVIPKTTEQQKEISAKQTTAEQNQPSAEKKTTRPIGSASSSSSSISKKQTEENNGTLSSPIVEEDIIKQVQNKQLAAEETTLLTESEEVTINSIEFLSPICINSALVIEAIVSQNVNEDLYYNWFIDGINILEYGLKTTYTFEESGKHTITLRVSHEGNLLAESSRSIDITPAPDLDFTSTDLKDVFYDQNVNVEVLNPINGNYRWLDEENTVKFGKETVFTFLNEGNHKVTLEHTSVEGCKTTIEKNVSMKKDFAEAFPNAFSTNGDGINDVFELKVLQIPNTKFELQIIDVHGNTVFKTHDAYEGWNGQLNNNGTALEKGTFVWIAIVENNRGIKRRFGGKVILNPSGL